MSRLVLLLGVVGCGEAGWTHDACLGAGTEGPTVLDIGEEVCVEVGQTGGLAGLIPEASLDGDCLALVDETTVGGDQGPDAAGTAFQLYEAVAIGTCTVSVAQRGASEPDFLLAFTVHGDD